MIDKTIPEKSIVMELDIKDTENISQPSLPEGFELRLFKAGDEFLWADIESSVNEFPDKSYAHAYFMLDYYRERFSDLKDRCLILTKDSLPVGTVMAWETNGIPHIHWLAVKPEFHGLGLGKAMLLSALNLFKELNPSQNIIVHTRTWSHKAVCLYHSVGFNMRKSALAYKNDGSFHKNEYYEAMEVLEKVLPQDIYKSLLSTTY